MKFILYTLIQVSKFSLYGLMFQCLIVTLAFAESHAQHRDLKSFNVSLEVKDKTLGKVFSQIEEVTGFKFTYVKSNVPLEEKVNISSSGDLRSILRN